MLEVQCVSLARSPSWMCSVSETLLRQSQLSALTLQLFGFLQSEARSVSELQAAIELFDAAPFTRVLQHNLRSHEERVRLLSSKILQLGGVMEPVQLYAGPGLAEPLGLLATMTALVASESRDQRVYQLAFVDVDAVTRPFLRWLLSEQCDSHLSAVDLHGVVGRAPPRRQVRTGRAAAVLLEESQARAVDLAEVTLCRLPLSDGEHPRRYGPATSL